jgi:hypothetical protein
MYPIRKLTIELNQDLHRLIEMMTETPKAIVNPIKPEKLFQKAK